MCRFISAFQNAASFFPIVTSRVRPFLCSSVDIFAFLYTLALGNSWWRNNPADPYTYLSGRESILDAILSTSPQQRRLSTFPNSNGAGFQPYILHTTDELSSASIPGTQTAQPSHAIAYRTVDTTVQMAVSGATFYGGAKLGMYSYWPCGATTPDSTKQQQYEFYNYTAGNVGEVGNSALISATQLDSLPALISPPITPPHRTNCTCSYPNSALRPRRRSVRTLHTLVPLVAEMTGERRPL